MALDWKRKKRISLISLCVIWFFTGVEYVVILPSAWEYLQSLGADNAHQYWLSLSVAAFSAASFVVSPIYGKFADNASAKTILIIANVFEILGNILYMCANDVYTVIEARFLAGVGAGAGAVIFAYVARVSETPQEIGTNIGLIMTSRAIGLVFGPAFNFILVNIDWQWGDLTINKLNSPGLFMVVVWTLCQVLSVCFFYDIPDEALAKQGAGAGAGGAAANAEKSKAEYLHKGIIVLLFVQFMQLFNQTSWETFLTPFTYDHFHWDQLFNSYVFMGTAVLAIGVYITITFVRKRYTIDDRTMLVVGMFLQCFGFVMYWAFPAKDISELYKFAIGGIIFVIGMPFVYVAPALQSKLTSRRTQGLGQGIRRSVVSLAQIFGPLWASTLSQPNMFWGIIVLFTFMAVCSLFIGWKWMDPAKGPNAPKATHEGDELMRLDGSAVNEEGDEEDEPLLEVSSDEDDAVLFE